MAAIDFASGVTSRISIQKLAALTAGALTDRRIDAPRENRGEL
jgi:hypothetical protein